MSCRLSATGIIFQIISGSLTGSFLKNPDKVTLSPHPVNGGQTGMVSGKGRNITDAGLIKTAAAADISEVKVKALIDQVNTALQVYNICGSSFSLNRPFYRHNTPEWIVPF